LLQRTPDQVLTVTQLARELGVSARTLRFYEDRGLIAPQRAGNARIYAPRDRARMILILRGKRLGFSLRDIAEYLDLYDADRTGVEQLRALQGAVAKRLASLLEQRAALEQSINELRDIQTKAEHAMAGRQKELLF
jgi:DNA-binding transcriptional MerR regulator